MSWSFFAAIFYFILPGISLYLILRGKLVIGIALLCMGAALHGIIFHFILDTPDYICYIGSTLYGRWFSVSAFALAIFDVLFIFIFGYGIMNRTTSENR